MMHHSEVHLKKWEIALAVSVVVAVGWGLFFGETRCCAWWGTVYPELLGSAGDAVPASTLGGGETVIVRLRIAEWIVALLRWLRG